MYTDKGDRYCRITIQEAKKYRGELTVILNLKVISWMNK